MKWHYIAYNDKDERKEGAVTAKSRDEAQRLVEKRKLEVVGVFKETGKDIFNHVKFEEKIALMRHLSLLVAASVPVPRAIDSFIAQATGTLRRILLQLERRLSNGEPLSSALARHPKHFNVFVTETVRAAEMNGTLPETLDDLANYFDRMHDFQAKVKSVAVYPMFVIALAIGVILFMGFFILPQMENMYHSLDLALPFGARVLLEVFRFLGEHKLLSSIVAIIFAVGGYAFSRNKMVRIQLQHVSLRTPVVRTFVQEISLIQITTILGYMIHHGVTLDIAMNVASKVVRNDFYKQTLLNVAKEIRAGGRPQHALGKYPIAFPASVTQIVATGEQTGKLGEMVGHINRFYIRSLDARLQSIGSIIEPVLIGCVALVVAGIAYIVITPVYSILSVF